MQEIALLGLWRGKFFEKAAFYGGTALRVLYGLDRFSEDLDFSLLTPCDAFDITRYSDFLQKEARGFGFDVRCEKTEKIVTTPIQSAFLKANTSTQLIVIEANDEIVNTIPKGRILKIKLEVDEARREVAPFVKYPENLSIWSPDFFLQMLLSGSNLLRVQTPL